LDVFTYDHRTLKTRLPVRSAIYKQCTGGLVVEFVRIGESPLLYVFGFTVAILWSNGGAKVGNSGAFLRPKAAL
jgi:hypothetical protein